MNSVFLSSDPKFIKLILLCEFWELIIKINYYHYRMWYTKFSAYQHLPQTKQIRKTSEPIDSWNINATKLYPIMTIKAKFVGKAASSGLAAFLLSVHPAPYSATLVFMPRQLLFTLALYQGGIGRGHCGTCRSILSCTWPVKHFSKGMQAHAQDILCQEVWCTGIPTQTQQRPLTGPAQLFYNHRLACFSTCL